MDATGRIARTTRRHIDATDVASLCDVSSPDTLQYVVYIRSRDFIAFNEFCKEWRIRWIRLDKSNGQTAFHVWGLPPCVEQLKSVWFVTEWHYVCSARLPGGSGNGDGEMLARHHKAIRSEWENVHTPKVVPLDDDGRETTRQETVFVNVTHVSEFVRLAKECGRDIRPVQADDASADEIAFAVPGGLPERMIAWLKS